MGGRKMLFKSSAQLQRILSFTRIVSNKEKSINLKILKIIKFGGIQWKKI